MHFFPRISSFLNLLKIFLNEIRKKQLKEGFADINKLKFEEKKLFLLNTSSTFIESKETNDLVSCVFVWCLIRVFGLQTKDKFLEVATENNFSLYNLNEFEQDVELTQLVFDLCTCRWVYYNALSLVYYPKITNDVRSNLIT